MRTIHVRLIPVALGVLGLMLALMGPAMAVHEGTTYRANLRTLNAPGAHGTVDLAYDDTAETLTVSLRARGLDDGVHIAHIHGFTDEDAPDARCPSRGDDTNRDGLVDLSEGAPIYGGILLALDEGDEGETIEYTRTFDVGDAGLGLLEEYHVVVHGVDLDGDGQVRPPFAEQDLAEDEGSMPALCGEIVRTGAAGGPRGR